MINIFFVIRAGPYKVKIFIRHSKKSESTENVRKEKR
jgi:hypothetical protein